MDEITERLARHGRIIPGRGDGSQSDAARGQSEVRRKNKLHPELHFPVLEPSPGEPVKE